MKHILITDTHVDLKGGVDWHHQQHSELYMIMFKYMKDHNIRSIIHLGDFFDSRKSPSTKSLKFVNDSFINPLIDNNMELTIITGNHDVYWRNTNSVNSLLLCIPKHRNIEIIDRPTVKYNTMMVPWITEDNYDEVINALENKEGLKASFGHHEFSGFTMTKNGVPQKKGRPAEIVSKYPYNYSGHFHGESITEYSWGMVHYLGSTFQQDKHDLDDPKAFFVYDDETGLVERVQHGVDTFIRVVISSPDQDIPNCTNKFVYIDVMNGVKQSEVDEIIAKIYMDNPYSVTIDNNFNVVEVSKDKEIHDIEKPQEMMELITDFVDNVNINHDAIDKEELKAKMRNLYERAF